MSYLAELTSAMVTKVWDRLPESIQEEMIGGYRETLEDPSDTAGALAMMMDNIHDDPEHCAEVAVWLAEELIDHFVPEDTNAV